jgi:hypothetical protein
MSIESEADKAARLKEVVDLLLAGGYFRARIPALSPFDKVRTQFCALYITLHQQ